MLIIRAKSSPVYKKQKISEITKYRKQGASRAVKKEASTGKEPPMSEIKLFQVTPHVQHRH